MKILNKAIALSVCAAMGLALTACAKNYDGTYRATLDCTDIMSNAMDGMELEGTIEADFILTMEKGEYSIEIDADKFETDMNDFINANIDNILIASFGTDDMDTLNEYATYMGYADYEEMKAGFVEEVMGSFSAEDFELDESGIEKPEPGQLLFDVVKPDRSDMDIVFEMMLKWGLELTLPVEKSEAAGYPIWSVACDELVCCMSRGLAIEALEAIADMEPRRVLILDSVLDDTLKLNAVQIFKHAGERMGCEIELRTV